MIAAFLGFAAGRIEPLRQFGIGLALAVLIDATIVRAILVPAPMVVLGRWNWWLPPGSRVCTRSGVAAHVNGRRGAGTPPSQVGPPPT